MAKQLDWEGIRRAFVEGVVDDTGLLRYPTLVELGLLFNATPDHIGRRAKTDNWEQQRTEHTARSQVERRRAMASDLVAQYEAINEHAVRVSLAGQALVERRLDRLTAQANAITAAAIASGDAQEGEDPGADILDSITMQRLARAEDVWVRVGRRATGEVDATVTDKELAEVLMDSDVRRMVEQIQKWQDDPDPDDADVIDISSRHTS